jgi:hypothetical protein
MTSKIQLDKRADVGFEDASNYDKFRPSYPPEVVEKLLGHLGLSGVKRARVVDLGSGTGKFTECMFPPYLHVHWSKLLDLCCISSCIGYALS